MKYVGTLITITVAAIVVSIALGINLCSAYSQPPVVRFSIPMPQYPNATEVSYTCSYNQFTTEFDKYRTDTTAFDETKIAFEYNKSFTGQARVGAEISFFFKFYGAAPDSTQVGLNTVTKTDTQYLGTQTIHIVVQELQDNIVGNFDQGNEFGFMIIAGIAAFFILPITSIFSYERDEFNSDNKTKGDS